MALIERLMGWGPDDDIAAPVVEKISVHHYFALVHLVAEGPRTQAQLKSYFNMDPAEAAEQDALAATRPSGSNNAAKFAQNIWVQNMHAIFLAAEDRVPFYSTPTEVRAELGI